MSIKKNITTAYFNNNPPNNPPPTGEQVRKIHQSRKSQSRIILEMAKRNGSISSEQMKSMGFYSGNKRVSELKQAGHIFIKTQDWKKNGLATYWYNGHRSEQDG